MKLLKLSLATALAAGSLATASFATPLEEAIKNVDLSGSLMLRYDYINDKTKKSSDSQWKMKGVLDFTTKFDDNFFAFAGLKIDDTDKRKSGNRSFASGEVELYNAYLGYKTGNTTVLVGRQTAGTFFTDDLYGDGIKVVNSDIEGLTLAALWLDNMNEDGDVSVKKITKTVYDKDLFGVAAIGSYEPVSFQLWYARLNEVTNLMAAELGFKFEVMEGTTLGLLAQYGHSDIDGKAKKATVLADGNFYGVKASANVSGFDFNTGFVSYSTKKGKESLNSFEDKGNFISAGEQLQKKYSLYEEKNRMWFVTAAYEIPDTGFKVGADYASLTEKKGDNKSKKNEIVARLSYKYSKKLNFSSYYSHLSIKDGGSKDKVRFQVKYSF